MLGRFIAFVLARPVSSAMVLLTLAALGVVAFNSLPSQLTPDVEYPRLTVRVGWQSAPPETMESMITAPLEGELSKLAELKTLSSVSSEGQSRLTLEFHPTVNMDMVRLDINERLSNLMETLPREVSPPQVSPYVPEEVEKMQGFLTYTLSANRSAGEVRRYAEEYLLLALRSVKGVRDVEIIGGLQRHISIELDRSAMEHLRLSPNDVTTALQDAYLTLSGARNVRANATTPRFVDADTSTTAVRLAHTTIVQSFNRIEDLLSLPIALRAQPIDNKNSTAEQHVIRLGDVATVRDDVAEPTAYYRLNGKETVTIRLSKEQGADIIRTADRVFAVIKRLEAGLPQGYALVKESDTSQSMRAELADLATTLLYAACAAALVMLLVFRRETAARMAVIVLLAVVFTLALAACGFAVCGLGLNIITTAAIVLGFGIAVDNAVIMAEHLERQWQWHTQWHVQWQTEHQYLRFRLRFIVHTRTMAVPLLGSAFTTLSVIVPLLFLNTELRAYLADFALSSLLIVCASVGVSIGVVPLVCYYWLPRRTVGSASHADQAGISNKPSITFRLYAAVVLLVARFRRTSVVLVVLLVGIPLWLLPSTIDVPYLAPVYNAVFDSPLYSYCKPHLHNVLGGAWNIFSNRLPHGDMWQLGNEEYLMVVMKLPNGNRIERINALTKALEQEILRYGANVKLLSASVVSEELAYLRVEFPKNLADRTFPYKLKNYLTAYATRLGGVEVSIFGYGEAFSTGFGGAPVSFAVVAKGFAYDDVKRLAEQFRRTLERNPRVTQVDIDRSGLWGEPEVYEQVLAIDRERLKRSGTTVAQVLPLVRANAIGVLGGSRFRLGNEEISYDVKYAGYKDNQAQSLLERECTAESGVLTTIGSVATLTERKALASIIRENRQYIRTITFEFQGPYRYGEEYLKQALAAVPVRPGYSLEATSRNFFFGNEQELDLLSALLLAVVLIVMVSAALFESLRLPVAVLCTIPIALMGAVYALWAFDLAIDRGSYAGMMLLVGLAVNVGIVMVYHLHQQMGRLPKAALQRALPLDALVELSYCRVRPVFITCCTTVLTMLPLALQSQHGFWQTLGATVIGGVVWSSAFLLIVLPVLLAALAQSSFTAQSSPVNRPR
jgi:multidrug efflux pump subunit AcrB